MKPLFLRLIDKTDPTMSLKHAAYGLVVLSGCGWLTLEVVKHSITTEWVTAFGLLLAAVTTGKVVGSAPSPAPTVGAPVDGGKA